MKQLKLGRNLSQPQLLSQSECFSITAKTMNLEQFQNPPLLASHPQFQQKYFQQVLDKNIFNQTLRKNESLENNKDSSLQRGIGTSQNEQAIKNSQDSIIRYQQKGISFSDYIEDKYQKLSTKQIKMIPASFLKTFNLIKEDFVVQQQVIKSPKKQKTDLQLINVQQNIFQNMKNKSIPQIQMFDPQDDQVIQTLSEQFVTSKQNTLIDVNGHQKKQKSRIELNRQVLLMKESRKVIKLDQLAKVKDQQSKEIIQSSTHSKNYKNEVQQINSSNNREYTNKPSSQNNIQRNNQFKSISIQQNQQIDDLNYQIQRADNKSRDYKQIEEKSNQNKFKQICQYCCFSNEKGDQVDYPQNCVCLSKLNLTKKNQLLTEKKVNSSEQEEINLDFLKLRNSQSYFPQFNSEYPQKQSGANQKQQQNISQESKNKRQFFSLEKIGSKNDQYIKKLELFEEKLQSLKNEEIQAKQKTLMEQFERQFQKKSPVNNYLNFKKQIHKSKDLYDNSDKNSQKGTILQSQLDGVRQQEIHKRLQLVGEDEVNESEDGNYASKSSQTKKLQSTPQSPFQSFRNKNNTNQKHPNQIISTTLKKILQQQREIDEYETKPMIDYAEIEQTLNKRQSKLDSPLSSPKQNKQSQFSSSKDSFYNNSQDFVVDFSRNNSVNSPKSVYSSQSPIAKIENFSLNMQISQIQSDARIRSFSQKVNSNQTNEQAQRLDLVSKYSDQKAPDSKYIKSKFQETKEFMTPQNKSQINNTIWGLNSPQNTPDQIENLNQATGKFFNSNEELFNKIGSDGKRLYIPSRIRGISEIFKKQSEQQLQLNSDSRDHSISFKTGSFEQQDPAKNHVQNIAGFQSQENSLSIFSRLDDIKKERKIESSTPTNKANNYQRADSFSSQNKQQNAQRESLKNSIYDEIVKKRKERTIQHQELQIKNKQQMIEAFDQKMREQQKLEINSKLAKLRLKHQGSIQLHQQKLTNQNSGQDRESDLASLHQIEGLIKNESQIFGVKDNQIKSSESISLNQITLNNRDSDQLNCENIKKDEETQNEQRHAEKQHIDQKEKPQDCQSEQKISRILSKRNNIQISINTQNFKEAEQDSQSDLSKSRQENEKQSHSPLPQIHMMINNDMMVSSLNQKSPSRLSMIGSRRVSIFQNITQKELEKQQKCLKTLYDDTNKIVQQFIDKIYCGEQEINDDEDEEEKNTGQTQQINYYSSINKKYIKESQTKYDIIQQYTKKLRKIFKREIIYASELQNILKSYFETCFIENCVPKSEIFVQFKLQKKTLEIIFSVFMFILEDNEYPIDVIAQAEINLKKNYKLIAFLPALHDELGGSNYMNKINLQYSAVLMKRLLDLYKNVEQDNFPNQNTTNQDIDPSTNNIKSKQEINLTTNQQPPMTINIYPSEQQNNKKIAYSIIESNIEEHFEQVFLRTSMKRISAMNLESQNIFSNNSEAAIESQQDKNIKYKYTTEQIECLHQQILNLLRFIYHNNSYSQLDMSNMVDKSSIKEICKVFEVNQICFFEIKESMWNTLQDFKVYITTILRLQEQLERYRYIITLVPLVDHLLSDSSLYESITREMEWRVQSNDSTVHGIFENQQTFKAFCHTLISEIVLKIKSSYNLDIFFRYLNLNVQQFDFISSIFIKSISHVGFDHSFCKDAEIKFKKIKYKLDLQISPIKLIGGQAGLRKIIDQAHQMILNPAYENEYTEYVKKFPEDLHNLLYEIPPNHISSKYNRRPGLKFLEYIMLSLFSHEDCYSIQDLRAGVQTYNIAKTTPIHWKSLLEYSMNNLKYSQSTIKTIIQEINTQLLIVFIDLSE
ncbi:hypothetical protein TTHERM_00077360 (macronuclear) [Tetrahymena thermophila SB210]|uniref:Uncharacterized protein n=1 Tax=Tetrahymena thermophila (strain SB210) TaxID=312017 RepID=Q23G28_TETTS|nr:hypothetical protein TTHERM_00077360 [Tetrahymena thermophila SB210]EAR95432.1 hypothetical protein TTHERM_00077360 [Tetrahymena thermophila SB210]|eukprot:XP_001015677.1 hypothetical protein TTHERM_00077360 [Tetrahymena thermophila SB210]